MKRTIIIFLLFTFIISCSTNKDPVDQLAAYMDRCLKVLEKYKENPSRAKIELFKINKGNETTIRDLGDELKKLNRSLSMEEKKEQTDKLAPIIERMLILIDESPTLLLDPDIANAFEPFDLGF